MAERGAGGARVGQVSATGFEQPHGSLSPGKQHELEERRSILVMREEEEEEDGAPPHRTRVDLDRGRGDTAGPPDPQ